MEPAYRQFLLVCLSLILQGIRFAETTMPPDGFKFNCGQDVCVFPRDYCNIGKQRCDVCTIHVCNELGVSSQCEQRCKELKGELELPTTDGPSEESLSTLIGKVATLSYVVGILAALLFIVIVFYVVKQVIACRTRDKSTDESNITQTYQQLSGQEEDSDVKPDQVTPTAPPQHLNMSKHIGSSVSVYQPSPSGQEGNYSTRGNYRLLPKTIPESSTEPPSGFGFRQQHPEEIHNASNIEELRLLDGPSLSTLTGVDTDATIVKNNNLSDSCDDIGAVPGDIEGSEPLPSGLSGHSCRGMTGAYTDSNITRDVPWASSNKSIISSTSRGSDSGNYSSASASETDNIAKEKGRLINKDNCLTANV